MTDPSPARDAASRWRLALLMFLVYGPPAAMLPLFSLHLRKLNFTHGEIGWCCATQALAGLFAPLIVGQVADRWWPAEFCLSACACLTAVILWALSWLTAPGAVFCTTLAVWLAMAPTMSLGAAVTFTHLAAPERDFGRVRLFGTVGWGLTCWLLAYWFWEPDWARGLRDWLRQAEPGSDLADIFRLGSVLAGVLGAYALTLPHTPPQRHATTWLAPIAALRLLRQRSFAVYCLVFLCWCMTIAFNNQVTPLLLEDYGVSRRALPLLLTVTQATEISSLAVLPAVLGCFGVRGTMLGGLCSWLAALAIFTGGKPFWLLLVALGCIGVCIPLFLVAGQVFINSRAHGDIRASAQALLALFAGIGMLAGNVLVGWVRHLFAGAHSPTYAVGAFLALLSLVAFALGFREGGNGEVADDSAEVAEAVAE